MLGKNKEQSMNLEKNGLDKEHLGMAKKNTRRRRGKR